MYLPLIFDKEFYNFYTTENVNNLLSFAFKYRAA